MKRITALFILLVALRCFSASWYVDCDRTGSGSNNGSDWDNAWTNLTRVTWSSLNPGDTVYISGGTYPIGAIDMDDMSGTAANPVTIKASQEAGHNDFIILNGRLSWNSEYFVVFDGAKDDSYTNIIGKNTFNVPQITNNINIRIDSTVTGENCFTVNGASNQTIRWVEMVGDTNVYKHGVYSSGTGIASGFVTEYCWLHNLGGDGVYIANNIAPEGWADFTVRYCLIEDVGDDGIEIGGGGLDAHHNIVRNTLNLNGHPDGIAPTSGHVRIYNNILYDWNTIPIYLSPAGSDFSTPSGLCYVYGNLVYSDDFNDDQEGALVYSTDAQSDTTGTVLITNLFIFNNSFLCSNGTKLLDPIILANRFSSDNGYSLSWNITNAVCMNNILLDGQGQAASFKGYAGPDIFFAEANFVVDWNLMSALSSDGYEIVYRNSGTPWANAIAFNNGTIFDNNKTNRPVFRYPQWHDYRLSGTDTAARNAGTNLTLFVTLGAGLPDLTNDLYGNVRGLDGSWDMGAIEYSDDAVCHLVFEDSFTDGQVDDITTNAVHMLRYGYAATPTNWPSQVLITNGSPRYAASFRGKLNLNPPGNEDDFWDGDYGAITNVTKMINVTNMTLAVWAYFDPSDTYHQATLLDAGYSSNGCWHFGRYYSSSYGQPQFDVITNAGNGSDSTRASWPTMTTSNWFTNGLWHHLGVVATLTNSASLKVKLYWMGTNCLETNYALATPIDAFTVSDIAGSANGPWIAVGCNTHIGTQSLDDADGLPNNGWFKGKMYDVRMYDKALTDDEMYQVFLDGGAQGSYDAGDEEESPATTNTVQKLQLRGRQAMRGNVRIR